MQTYVAGGSWPSYSQHSASLPARSRRRFAPTAVLQQPPKTHEAIQVASATDVSGAVQHAASASAAPQQQRLASWTMTQHQPQQYTPGRQQHQQGQYAAGQQQLPYSFPFIDGHTEQCSCGQASSQFISSVQECTHWGHIAQLVDSQQQHQQLTISEVSVALQQLCQCTPVRSLSAQQRQQLDVTLQQLANAVLQQLPQLHHQHVGELLAMFHVLSFKPTATWVRSMLQHAGTELVHYTPAELALLLLTATQAVTRLSRPETLPVMQFSRSSPSAGLVVTLIAAEDASVPATASFSDSTSSESGSSDSSSSRRANTVLTSAWLQHFMTTFERYIACRTAHPQLQPQHMEAVITCFAALKVVPDKLWLYLFVRQLSAQLPACQPPSIVRMLSALANMGYKLPEHVVSQIERQVGGPALTTLRPVDCVEVVRSVAALKHKPSDAWVQQLLAYVLKGSTHLNASAIVTLMVCTAALGIDLNPSWVDMLLLQARAALQMLSAPEHVSLMDALSQQHHRPGPVFMSLYMTQVQAHLPELSLVQQSVLIASLASVGYKPAPAWMSAFMGQLAGQSVTAADAGELLKLLAALRRMQYVPTAQAAQQIDGLIDSIAVSLPYQQLQQLRAALADLQYRPYVAAAAGGSSSSSFGVRSSQQAAVQPAALESASQNSSSSNKSSSEGVLEAEAAGIAVTEGQAAGQQQAATPEQQDSSSDSGQLDMQTAKPSNVMESLELFA